MTTRAYPTPVPCIYGEGVPALLADNGCRYIDTVTGIEYVRYGGAWNPTGTGGGGGGLPYYSGPYGWYVEPPYGPYAGNFYLSGSQLGPYGGSVKIQGGSSPTFGGAINLTGGIAATPSTSGQISFYSAYQIFARAPPYSLKVSYAGIYMVLPNAPGPSGSLYTLAGVVKVAP